MNMANMVRVARPGAVDEYHLAEPWPLFILGLDACAQGRLGRHGYLADVSCHPSLEGWIGNGYVRAPGYGMPASESRGWVERGEDDFAQ
jgi:hypothetical protein